MIPPRRGKGERRVGAPPFSAKGKAKGPEPRNVGAVGAPTP